MLSLNPIAFFTSALLFRRLDHLHHPGPAVIVGPVGERQPGFELFGNRDDPRIEFHVDTPHRNGLLVPWNRDGLHKPRSAAPDWQGAKSEHIGHM